MSAARDHRDLVIEDLAFSKVALLASVADLEVALEAERELAHEVVHVLHEETIVHERTRQQLRHLRDEYRNLRAQVLKESTRTEAAA